MSDNLKKKLLVLKHTKAKAKRIEEFYGNKLFIYENDFLAIGSNYALLSGMKYDQDMKKKAFEKYPNRVFTQKIGSRIPEFNMIFCQKGSFLMGKNALYYEYHNFDIRNHSHKLEREVTLTKSFLLGETKVSQGLFESVMKDIGQDVVDSWKNKKHELRFDSANYFDANKPVFSLTWFDALRFCNVLSIKKGLQPCYELTPIKFDLDLQNNDDNEAFDSAMRYGIRQVSSYEVKKIENANGYRLPTEAEWEYAALANSDFMLNPPNPLDYIAHSKEFNEDGERLTVLVDNKTTKPNPWGFYDMMGNTYEFCEDDFDFHAYDLIFDREDELIALLGKKSVDPCSWTQYPYYTDASGKKHFVEKRIRGIDLREMNIQLSYLDEDKFMDEIGVKITNQFHSTAIHKNQNGYEDYVGIRLARTIDG